MTCHACGSLVATTGACVCGAITPQPRELLTVRVEHTALVAGAVEKMPLMIAWPEGGEERLASNPALVALLRAWWEARR